MLDPNCPNERVMQTGGRNLAKVAAASSVLALAIVSLSGCRTEAASNEGKTELLNVSYDVTRELFREVNPTAAASLEQQGLPGVVVKQSHGGSGSQARAVIDGLEADVVSLALWFDVDALRKQGLIDDGDVQLAWENEAWFAVKESGGNVEIVYPPVSIRAEPHVAVVDQNVRRHGTEKAAKAYLEGLYAAPAQELFEKYHLRPGDPAVLAKFEQQFPAIELFGIEAVATNWDEAQRKFFADGGVFDNFYKPRREIEPRE